MRNNMRGLLFHFFTIIIVFSLAFIINLSENLREFVYGNLFFRIFLTLIPLLLYYNFGKGMSKKTARQLDFLTGNIIVLMAILLGIVSFLGLGKNPLAEPPGTNMWKFPLELFLMPQIYIIKINRLPLNMGTVLISSFIPGLLYGISIKRSRARWKRRMRSIRHQQEMRRKSQRRRR
ncbi:MAG: hypothetical protein Q4P25_02755 [Tissierellia bacterium]|nr:hypothetical protein [Tissierellia bacterium]